MNSSVHRQLSICRLFLFILGFLLALAGCQSVGQAGREGSNDPDGGSAKHGRPLVLGFSQVGNEGGWREANTISIQEAAQDSGIELRYTNALQSQESQIEAIRSFIEQKADIIAFSPVIESGWDEVLTEAKEAGIPVILTDRGINSQDTSLYTTQLGSDFVEEGRKAGRWLLEEFHRRGNEIHIAELRGTNNSAPTLDRNRGFMEVISDQPRYKITMSETGEFTRAKGKEVMERFLKDSQQYNKRIDVLFSHNDDMALGAIEAMEEAGLKPGKDIVIISFDGIHEALQAVADGKINVVIECNPLLGPQLMQAALDIYAGKTVFKRLVTMEGIFTMDNVAQVLSNRKY